MTGSLDDLIAAAQTGNQQAFFQIYQEFKGRVYAICLRLCADRAQAEDATQEVFLKVWQQLPLFRGDSAFSTWLHPIACRTAVDLWRKNKVSRLCSDVAEQPEIALPANHPDADLEQAILRLPDQARAVFVLFALEGYQHQEIAQLLQIAVGTSKAQYHRARQLLMEWLDAE
jgi:RNA polymerase sigma factor (sigma-70 family)